MMFSGPEAVGRYRAITIAAGLRLYARTGMKPNRAYTPKAMMKAAQAITGQTFKPRDYQAASDALRRYAGIEPDAPSQA